MDYKRVLRLHYLNGFSGRAIAESTGDGKTTVNEFLKRFRENEVLSWPLSDDVTNELIEKLLYQLWGACANTKKSDAHSITLFANLHASAQVAPLRCPIL